MRRTFFIGFPLSQIKSIAIVITVILIANFLPSTSFAQNAMSKLSRFWAWQLGSQISKTAVLYLVSNSPQTANKTFNLLRPAAQYFGAEIPPLPPMTGKRDDDAFSIQHYLLGTCKTSIEDKIGSNHSIDHRYLWKIAVESHILLITYKPSGYSGEYAAKFMRDHAPKAGLPNNMWLPFVNKLEAEASYNEVKAALIRMDQEISTFLRHNN